MNYDIYFHSYKEKINSLDFENFTGKPIRKSKREKLDDLEQKNEAMLKYMKRDLLKQLADIDKQLKK